MYTTKMFIRTRKNKGNEYFYLVENERVQGKPTPVQKLIAYLGNRDAAIARGAESSDYPSKDELLARVRAAVPVTGKNKGKRGRPQKTKSGAIAPTHLEAHHDQLQQRATGADKS